LPNMAFVGIYRGTNWGVMELQARWANMVFAGILPSPSTKAMLEGIDSELIIRTQKPRPQFPHDSSVELLESLGKEIGVIPNMECLKANDPQLYSEMLHTPIISAHYRLSGFGKNPAVAKQIIDELYQFMQKNNHTIPNDPHGVEALSTSEAINNSQGSILVAGE